MTCERCGEKERENDVEKKKYYSTQSTVIRINAWKNENKNNSVSNVVKAE